MAASPDPDENGGLSGALADVSDRTTKIVQEEIELAKAEISAKIGNLARAAAIAGVAGIFVVVGLLFLLDTLAWGIWDAIGNGQNIWVGFLITSGILFLLAGLAGVLIWRLVKKGTPPVPQMAIDEAKLVRETLKTPAPEKTP